MFNVTPPPTTKEHWVYDDPSGVADHRPTERGPRKLVRRPLRLIHQDC